MISRLWNRYKEYILYLFFGGLTTLVNYVVYFLLTRPLGMPDILLANTISWIIAVTFAYFTNRKWVFESKAKGAGQILKEAGKFVAGRLFTLGTESLIIWIFAEILGINDLIIKVSASIITIVLNYLFSKFIIFTSR